MGLRDFVKRRREQPCVVQDNKRRPKYQPELRDAWLALKTDFPDRALRLAEAQGSARKILGMSRHEYSRQDDEGSSSSTARSRRHGVVEHTGGRGVLRIREEAN